jgi:putative ABC transport system permease protein
VGVEGKAYAQDRDYPETHFVTTYPGYFRTFQSQVRGRDFTSTDGQASQPVAIVNETFVRKYFAGQDPVGRRIRLGDSKSTEPWRTIVGVVPDLWVDGLDNKKPEAIYLPFAQAPQRFVSVAIRTRGTPAQMTAPVRRLVSGLDPDLPIYFVDTLQGRIDENSWFYRVFGALFTIMGAVALVLAGVGLYGVMSFNVARRTREMGVRMALGAQPGAVVGLVMRQGAIQLALGLAFGSALAYLLSRGLQAILFQVSGMDPAVVAVTFLVLTASALAASWIPARRATRVDPLIALRYE